MAKDLQFLEAKELVAENLEAIKLDLTECVDEGMIDTDDYFYNETLDLLENTALVKSWDELLEIVMKAKTLETDIAAWLSLHGRTTMSLPWPKKNT